MSFRELLHSYNNTDALHSYNNTDATISNHTIFYVRHKHYWFLKLQIKASTFLLIYTLLAITNYTIKDALFIHTYK